MGKKGKRYHAAPWSEDYDPKKRGGVAPWYRKRAKRHDGAARDQPWSSSFNRAMRGGGR